MHASIMHPIILSASISSFPKPRDRRTSKDSDGDISSCPLVDRPRDRRSEHGSARENRHEHPESGADVFDFAQFHNRGEDQRAEVAPCEPVDEGNHGSEYVRV